MVKLVWQLSFICGMDFALNQKHADRIRVKLIRDNWSDEL